MPSSESEDKQGPIDNGLVNGRGEEDYVKFDVLEEEENNLPSLTI